MRLPLFLLLVAMLPTGVMADEREPIRPVVLNDKLYYQLPGNGSNLAFEFKTEVGLIAHLSGPIVEGDYERFVAFVSLNWPHFSDVNSLLLGSSGGNVYEAEKIASLITQMHPIVMVVDDVAHCVSACFLLFAAAAHRFVPEFSVPENYATGVGIHRPYLPDDLARGMRMDDLRRAQREMNDHMAQLLADLDVPRDLMDLLFSRASDEIYWLTTSDIRRLGRLAPWYEEALIAQCEYSNARFKSLERDSWSDAFSYVLQASLCMSKKTKAARILYLYDELNEIKNTRPTFYGQVQGLMAVDPQ